MSDNHQHINTPFHDPAAGSLANALGRFEALPDETLSRKTRVRAAVREPHPGRHVSWRKSPSRSRSSSTRRSGGRIW
jgi:hypothetical protein